MLKAVRLCLALAALCVGVWACFSVKLGAHTFAEHMDAIGQTPQAEALIEGTRNTIHPAMERTRARVLGEYVTAPTYVEGERPMPSGSAMKQEASTVRERQERRRSPVHAASAEQTPARRTQPSSRGPTQAGTARVPGGGPRPL